MTTDYVVLISIIYFFYKGWKKGVLRTLLGPISLVIGGYVGFAHYQKTQDMITGLLICIISPFILTILGSAILKIWHSAVEKKDYIPTPSRFIGGIFSALWGSTYLIMMLVMIAIIPAKFEWFEPIQKNVAMSNSYIFVNEWLSKKVPAASFDIKKLTSAFEDPETLRRVESTKEYNDLMSDPNLKEIFTDEETAKQIEEKNYTQLLSNSKIQAVFQDEALLKKVFALNKKILQDDPAEETTQEPAQPKIINIEQN